MIGRSAPTTTGPGRARLARSPQLSALALLVAAGGVVAAGMLAPAVAQDPPAATPAPRARATRPVEPPANEALPAVLAPAQEEPAPGSLVTQRPRRLATAPPAAPADPEIIPAAIGEPPADPAGEDAGHPGLPGATLPPGGTAAAAGAGGDAADSFFLKPDRIPVGKQQVNLSVEVQAKGIINLDKETPVRIVVRNDGSTDAYGVAVVYQLPESLQFVSSELQPVQLPANPQIYTWNKGMMAAGGEWSIGLKVKAKNTKPCEHVAHVTAKAGSKVNTTVHEPKLKVEAKPNVGMVLKGGQVAFEITVSNPGTGPARNVTVHAKLSEGLRLGEDDEVEQTIDLIEPGKPVRLEILRLDTVAGGMQTATFAVSSPDVNSVPEEHQIQKTVEVTKPELDVQLAGQEVRYTGQPIEYHLTVTNSGTASAKAILVSVALPQEGGKLRGQAPDKASWSLKERKLFWKVPQLAPKESFESKFIYDTSTPRLYRCTAEATAGPLRASKVTVTEVTGIADLDLKVEQQDRVIDVGKATYYDFIIKNLGTKEATQILCSGKLVNLKVIQAFKGKTQGNFEAKPGTGDQPTQFLFPVIPKLAAGESITLSLEVEALKRGRASASVDLAFDGMVGDETVKGAITTTVTDNNGPTARSGGAR